MNRSFVRLTVTALTPFPINISYITLGWSVHIISYRIDVKLLSLLGRKSDDRSLKPRVIYVNGAWPQIIFIVSPMETNQKLLCTSDLLKRVTCSMLACFDFSCYSCLQVTECLRCFRTKSRNKKKEYSAK